MAEEETDNLADRAIERQSSNSVNDFKLLQERIDRFEENRRLLGDEDGFEMPEPVVSD